MNCSILHNFLPLLVVLATILLSHVPVYAAEQRDEECVKCHQQLWDDALQKTFIHKPFLEKKCHFCHINDQQSVKKTRGFMTERGIEWLGSRRMLTGSHWFFVKADKVDDKLLVDIQIPGKKNMRREITLPPFAEIEELKDDGRSCEISDVQVAGVERGLFLTATVVWKTGKDCSSQILYGQKKLKQKSELDSNLSTDHLMVISGLKPRKKYSYRIDAIDLFGNRTSSEIYTFNTHKARKAGGSARHNYKVENGVKLKIKPEIYRHDDEFIFKFTANRPVVVAIGVENDADDDSGASPTKGPAPEQHQLKDAVVTNNHICEPCHGVYVKGNNHPVNVPPKPGMTIPDDYFVLNNGYITCMTCHSAHSSDYEYRMSRSNKRELCIGCHKSKS